MQFRPTGNAAAIMRRAARLDQQALVRVGDERLYLTTPFDVTLSLPAPGAPTGVWGVADILAAGEGTSREASWPGALPPSTGFDFLDEVPGGVVEKLIDEGRTLAQAHAGPLGVPKSLLEQSVLVVEGREVPMKLLFACDVFGLIPPAGQGLDTRLRVSACGRWLRVDTLVATAFYSRGLPLL